MKRRFLAGILAVCMLSPISAFATEKRAEFKKSEYELAQNVMDKLGILEYSEDDLNDIISRVDFAVYLARLLKVNEYEMQDFTYYTDIVKNHYGLKSINYLTQIGGFNGYGNSEFRPDDPISPLEATKVIFNVLGYKDYADSLGGYPGAYLEMASRTELLDGFSGCENLTREEIAVLLCRAGLIGMANIDSGNASGFVLKSNEDDTAFARYWDVYEKEGVVTSADFTSIKDKTDGKEGYIGLDDGLYLYGETDASKLLGRYVNALVIENSDTEELVWAVVDDKKNEEITINAEDVESYSDFVIKYYNENGKLKSENIESDAVFVYNGTVLEYDIDDKIEGINKGDISLIDSDGDNAADTVIINDYKTCVVGYIDHENEIIYDEFLKRQIISLKDYKHKKFYSINGNPLDINSVSAGAVLNIKESSGIYADIFVQSAVTSGTVTEIFTDEKTEKYGVEIDNKNKYLFDSDFVENSSWFKDGEFNGNPGESINFITDKFGEVANITGFGNGNKQTGYIMKVWYTDDETESVKFKLLKADGSIESFDMSEKAQVDGKRYKSVKEAYDAICLGDKKVMLYTVGADGKINYVDTSYKSESESANSLFEATPIERESWELADPRYPGCRQWFLRDVSFSGIIMPYSKTVIFQVPEDAEGKGDEYYSVTSYSSFNDGKQIKCNSYKFGEENFFDDVLVLYTSGVSTLKSDAPMLAINKVIKVATQDGDSAYKLYGISRGKDVSYIVNSTCMELGFENSANSEVFTEAGQLEPGDLIQFGMDEKGQISSIRLLVDISDGVDKIPAFANNAYYGLTQIGADYALNRAYCKKSSPNGIELSFEKGKTIKWKASTINGSPTVTVVDTSQSKEMVRTGTLADVLSYDIAGEDSKPLYIYSTRMFMVDVVVYK